MTSRPLSIAETIKALGVSEKTIRRMLKDGMLHEHSRDPRGRILITPESIAAAAEQLAERHQADNPTPAASPIVLASQTTSIERVNAGLLDQLREAQQYAREQVDEIRRLERENVELRTAQKLLPSPGRVQELEQEVANLRAQLAERDRPMTDQPTQPTIKGWIARLLGRDQDRDR